METVAVKQIHDDFDAAADSLLREAGLKQSEQGFNVIEQEKKAVRLKLLGFTNSKEVSSVDKIKQDRLREYIAIHYKKMYPFLKFITENQLNYICNKYGLVYSSVRRYIGDIPMKNLEEIEKATIKDDDLIRKPEKPETSNKLEIELEKEKDLENRISVKTRYLEEIRSLSRTYRSEVEKYYERVDELFIAAPESLFMSSERVGNELRSKASVKDPIVFRWVKGGLLIITKWGEEANDSALVIPELN
jgi:hypothetical protein